MRAREAMHSTAQCARKSSESLTFTTIITATYMSKQSLCGLLSLHTRSVCTRSHVKNSYQTEATKCSPVLMLLHACVCMWTSEFFFVGSDTDTVIHTKLNSVTSEAYLIKSCGKFSVEFVSYFRTFRSSVHFIPCVLTFNSSLGMFVGLFTFVVCHFLCVKTQAQRKTYNSSMWFTFMRIKWTERKTIFPTISPE